MSLYLGLDLSTQSLKAIIIDISLSKIIHTETINFEKDLPQFGSSNGYFINPKNPLNIYSCPDMWISALDLIFERMKNKNIPLNKIMGISGSCQQHGSVYLNSEFENTIKNLDISHNLSSHLKNIFTRKICPIWMDRSTLEECKELYEIFGEKIKNLTGSPPIERFTGPQIRKFWKTECENYNKTHKIHLVSSFIASILIGKNAPLDYGDASGMNLLNLQNFQWDSEICEKTAPNLLKKLPELVKSNTIIGKLSKYFTKYGFSENIPIVAFTGDNPSSLVGTGCSNPNSAVISLGTSDTFFIANDKFIIDSNGYGHVFGNPAGGYMLLLCFTNGSLAREKMRESTGLSWEKLNSLILQNTVPGNNGNFMLPFFTCESVPRILKPQVQFFGSEEFKLQKSPPEQKIRAILESQAIRMKLHSQKIITKILKLRITGGASENRIFCQILADVFQIPIETICSTEAAAIGSALRAAHLYEKISFELLFEKFAKTVEKYEPNPKNAEIYEKLLCEYEKAEINFIKNL